MDCRLAMAMLMAPDSVDSIVCDPPYGLSKEPDMAEVLTHWLNGDDYEHSSNGFMGRSWDSFVPGPSVWREAYRVLKPGGHLIAFFGTRTYDLGVLALRLAGFEVRDQLAWVFGSGFPKSHSVDKATQKIVEDRYGKERCDCVDCGNGLSLGDDAGRGIRAAPRDDGWTGGGPTESVGDPQLSVETEGWPGSLRQLLENDRPSAPGSQAVEEAVLFEGLRERGPETAGQRDPSIRAGVEEPTGRNSQATAGLSGVREDARTERGGPSRSSFEAVSLRGNEPASQSRGAVRLLPSSGGGDDRTSPVRDPNRYYARSVDLDDFGRSERAVARVCSWCGLPDAEWLESLVPLGSALKPAYEPIVLCRKPLSEPTVAANVLRWGTGALNIDGCRIGDEVLPEQKAGQARIGTFERTDMVTPERTGRWPANLAHDGSDEVRAGFPDSKGQLASVGPANGDRSSVNTYGDYGPRPETPPRGDSGSAARFFYCAKASKSDRNAGLEDLPERPTAASEFRPNHTEGAAAGEDGNPYGRWSPVRNVHPTVKPTALMQWLVRMVTPPGGLVLDPFTGSGSTGRAAIREGFSFVGCEMTPEYAEIARLRIDHAVKSR